MTFVNESKLIHSPQLASYSHCPSHAKSRTTYQWISSKAYHPPMGKIPFLLWSIGSANQPTSSPLYIPYIAKTVAEIFVENIVKLHRMPISIISDRDLIFTSHFWQEFFKMSGTQLQMSSSYHLQTDGQPKIVNRSLEQYLLCLGHQ